MGLLDKIKSMLAENAGRVAVLDPSESFEVRVALPDIERRDQLGEREMSLALERALDNAIGVVASVMVDADVVVEDDGE